MMAWGNGPTFGGQDGMVRPVWWKGNGGQLRWETGVAWERSFFWGTNSVVMGRRKRPRSMVTVRVLCTPQWLVSTRETPLHMHRGPGAVPRGCRVRARCRRDGSLGSITTTTEAAARREVARRGAGRWNQEVAAPCRPVASRDDIAFSGEICQRNVGGYK